MTSVRIPRLRGHPRLVEFVISVVIGVLLEAALLWGPKLHLVSVIADMLADRMIGLSLAVSSRIDASPGFVLIDIHDATWHGPRWDRALVTPHIAIRDLLERVAPSRAAMILVDVDLAFAGGDPAPLHRFLADYPAGAPGLILVRSTISPDPGGGSIYPSLRPTAFDDVMQDRPNIYWGATLFEQDTDGMVRRWDLAQTACEDGHPIVLPSVELIAAHLARDSSTVPAQRDWLQKSWPPCCPTIAHHADEILNRSRSTNPSFRLCSRARTSAPG